MKITIGRMWVDGNLPGGLLMLHTLEAWWIRWSIVMSSGDRTSTDETWRLFRAYVGTPDGSWPTNKRWCVTCWCWFRGSTTMFRPFPDLLRRLGLLTQHRWLLPSWSLLSMSLASKGAVSRSRRTMSGCIQIGTLNGSTVYPILLSSTLLPFLSTMFPDLSTRWLLLSRSGSDILSTHSRSSATSEAEWSMQWRFLRWFQIHSFSAFWRASSLIMPCLTRCRLRWGGVGVHETSSRVIFFMTFVPL